MKTNFTVRDALTKRVKNPRQLPSGGNESYGTRYNTAQLENKFQETEAMTADSLRSALTRYAVDPDRSTAHRSSSDTLEREMPADPILINVTRVKSRRRRFDRVVQESAHHRRGCSNW